MVNIAIDESIGKLVITTDNPGVQCLLEFKSVKTVYQPWIRQWRNQEVIDRLYENKRPSKPDKHGYYKFVLGKGWIAYVINVFKDMISADNYNYLLRSIYSESYREHPFPGLRDYQNQDVLHILKYKMGLVTVNTGYGK